MSYEHGKNEDIEGEVVTRTVREMFIGPRCLESPVGKLNNGEKV